MTLVAAGPVRIRDTWARFWLDQLRLVPTLTLAVIQWHLWLELRFPILVTLGVVGLSAGFSRRYGVTLTPTEIVVHRARRRRIPWSQIRAVTSDGRRIFLWTERPNPLMLPAPTSGGRVGRRHLDDSLHRIGQWWLAHRDSV